MDINKLHPVSEFEWHIEPAGGMYVPGIIYASKDLIAGMDDKVYEQVCNVARLPGIINASYAMPDAHWGYGFPIGGVAAFDPDEGGIISAGGVGFDISCGVRTLHTGLNLDQVLRQQNYIADVLYEHVPAGLGSTGIYRLNKKQMNEMLLGGARWAVEQGLGEREGHKAGAKNVVDNVLNFVRDSGVEYLTLWLFSIRLMQHLLLP